MATRKRASKKIKTIPLPTGKVKALHGVYADCILCKNTARFGMVTEKGFFCTSCYEACLAAQETK